MSKAEGIRIFLRIRPPVTAQHGALLSSSSSNGGGSSSSGVVDNAPCDYSVEHSFSESTVRLHVGRRHDGVHDIVNNSAEDYAFRFRRVFEPQSTQADVFASVAKDSVQSVLDGYNATVFAYGQTGSGKTYSITGGTDSYDDRGIIPRALAMIYDAIRAHNNNNNNNSNNNNNNNSNSNGNDVSNNSHTTSAAAMQWSVHVSYLQIYNDRGQDLLNGGKDAKTLDELPVVTVHEGEEGDVVLRGLQAHHAPTLSDALDLLFLGDTNRLYCETPMNRTSSRSHCIFTVALEARDVSTATLRRSKLHLVDLAGSERVAKAGVVGNTLTEAKHINLSLHYLEHVIVALGEQAKGTRDHIPFRNSFMTMVLRDSLGGNCRTTMLATAHLARSMLPETVSTCQFAQRVARIKQEAHINVEADPALLVRRLRAEVAQLRDRLAFYERNSGNNGSDSSSGGGGAERELSADEQRMCERMVEAFVNDDDAHARLTGFEGDLARVYYCTELLKRRVRAGTTTATTNNNNSSNNSNGGGGVATTTTTTTVDAAAWQALRSDADALRTALQQKENEVNVLLDMLRHARGSPQNASTQTGNDSANGDNNNNDASSSSPYDRDTIVALVQQLRRTCNGTTGATTTRREDNTAHATPTDTTTTTTTAAAEAAPHAEAALARVHELTHAGKLSDADAAAARVFLLRRSEARLAEAYNLDALTDAALLRDRAAAFDAFRASYRNYAAVTRCKETLKDKYAQCKATARDLNGLVDGIRQTKTRVQRLRAERAADGVADADAEERALLDTLTQQKQAYNTLASTLRAQKDEIDGMHAFMKRSQEQLARDYEEWLDLRQAQVAMALGSGNNNNNNAVAAGDDKENNSNSNNRSKPSTTPPIGAAVEQHHEVRYASSAPALAAMGASHADTTSSSQQQKQQEQQQLQLTRINGWTEATRRPSSQQQHVRTAAAAAAAPLSSASTTAAAAAMGTGNSAPLSLAAPSRLSVSLPVSSHAYNNNNSGSNGAATTPAPLAAAATTSFARSAVVLDWSGKAMTAATVLNNSSNNSNNTATTSVMPVSAHRRLQPLEPLPTTRAAAAAAAATVVPSLSSSSSHAAAAAMALRTVAPLPSSSTAPLRDATTAALCATTTAATTSPALPRETVNAFAPTHRSTGDRAADEQLAALYRVRDAMRAQLQP